MLVTICESHDQVRHDIESAHGEWVVSLDPRDAPRRHVGHARAAVLQDGSARLGGVAVVLGDAWAPDPLQIRIIEEPPIPESSGTSIVLIRSQLPVQIRVGSVPATMRLHREGFGLWRGRSWIEPIPEDLPDAYDDAEPYIAPGDEE